MSEFFELAQRISESIIAKEQMSLSDQNIDQIDRGAIGIDDLQKIVSDCLNTSIGSINCYPGLPSRQCFNIAVFIALESPALVRKRNGHLSCAMAIEKIVLHMDGDCKGVTHNAIFITDHWDAKAIEKWKTFLVRIKKKSQLEIYMIDRLVNGNVVKIS